MHSNTHSHTPHTLTHTFLTLHTHSHHSHTLNTENQTSNQGPLLVSVFAGVGGSAFTNEMRTAWAWYLKGAGFRVQGCRGAGFRVQGAGVQGSGCWV